MNRDNIKKLIESLKVTETFHQGRWAHVNCGSPGCIGGHAAVLAGATDLTASTCYFKGMIHKISYVGRIWLDLDYDDMGDLFLNYPLDRDISVQDAIATLQHLLDTGEVKWSGSSIERLNG